MGSSIPLPHGELCLQRQQREVPAATAHRVGMESVQRKDGDSRRIRDVQRLAGCTGIPNGSECAIQSHLQCQQCAASQVFPSRFLSAFRGKVSSRRCAAGFEAADTDFLFASDRAGIDSEHFSHRRIPRIARISRDYRVGCQRTRARELPGIALSRHISGSLYSVGHSGYGLTHTSGHLLRAGCLQRTNTTCNASLGAPGLGSHGDSSYNALQVDLNHRFSQGLTLRGVYTWSKALDDGDSLNATTANNAPGLVSNPYNLRADRGLATYNATNVAYQYRVRVAIGHGKRFASGVSGWTDRFLSGWSINSIVTAQSGLPFTPQLSYNPSNNGDSKNPVRPFLNPNFSGPVILGSRTNGSIRMPFC